MPTGPRPPSAPLPVDRDARTRTPVPEGKPRSVLAVVGDRSEAVSLAPVVRRLRGDARFCVRLLSLARQGDHVETALAAFGQAADLDLMRGGGPSVRRRSAARARSALREELARARPDWILVQGASVATHRAARAADSAGVAIAHLGAGLRPGTDGTPRCEGERHRALSHLAALHLVHDEAAREVLLDEGVQPGVVQLVLAPGADAALELHQRVAELEARDFAPELGPLLVGLLRGWDGRLVLVTARRRAVLDELCSAVRSAAARHPDWLLVWPVHPATRVQTRVHQRLSNVANVVLCEPLGLATFIWLVARSDAVLTDSIALQEQGAALGRPVLVARARVERADLAHSGLVRPVGARALGILAGLERLLLDHALYAQLARPARPAPQGAAEEVVNALWRAAQRGALGRGVPA